MKKWEPWSWLEFFGGIALIAYLFLQGIGAVK